MQVVARTLYKVCGVVYIKVRNLPCTLSRSKRSNPAAVTLSISVQPQTLRYEAANHLLEGHLPKSSAMLNVNSDPIKTGLSPRSRSQRLVNSLT